MLLRSGMIRARWASARILCSTVTAAWEASCKARPRQRSGASSRRCAGSTVTTLASHENDQLHPGSPSRTMRAGRRAAIRTSPSSSARRFSAARSTAGSATGVVSALLWMLIGSAPQFAAPSGLPGGRGRVVPAGDRPVRAPRGQRPPDRCHGRRGQPSATSRQASSVS